MAGEGTNREEQRGKLAEAREKTAELEARVAAHRQAEKSLERRLADLSALHAMATIVNESLEMEEILDRALDEVLGKV